MRSGPRLTFLKRASLPLVLMSRNIEATSIPPPKAFSALPQLTIAVGVWTMHNLDDLLLDAGSK
jgi:hypothetical protein